MKFHRRERVIDLDQLEGAASATRVGGLAPASAEAVGRRSRGRAARAARAAAVVVVFAAAASGVAYAMIPGSQGVISACIDKNGEFRAIDSEAGAVCPRGQTPVQWSTGEPVTKMWAVVRRDGTLIAGHGHGAVSVTRVVAGVYEVDFVRDPAFCGISGTLGVQTGFGPDGNSPLYQGEIVVQPDGATATSAEVLTFDSSGVRADRDFELLVIC